MLRTPVCMAAILLLQRGMMADGKAKKAAGADGLCMSEWRLALLRGLLAWRIERPGIVDLGDLVIAEAKHLAQDLISMLAKQW